MQRTAVLAKRIVFVTGKGGVGRTTVAAALAKTAARAGRSVLLCDTLDHAERYSFLARRFGLDKFSPEEEVAAGIWGCHLHARTGHELFLREALPGGALIAAAIRSRALQRFLTAAPSFREMGIFNHILTLTKRRRRDGSPRYDHVIVDMPASGHTLALTSLPDILLRLMPGGPIATLLREGQRIFHDPAMTAAWVVTLPEALPVSESIELVEGLGETGVPVGGLILNRVLEDPFDDDEKAALAALAETGPLYGYGAIERLEDCAKQTARLREATDFPVILLDDVGAEGAELLHALAAQLQASAVCA